MKTDMANVYITFSSVLCPLEIMESSEERPLRESGVWAVVEKQVWSSAYVRSVRGGPAYSHPSEPKGHIFLQKRAMKAEHKCLQESMLVRDTNILLTVHRAVQMICHNPPRCSPWAAICSEGTLHLQRLHPSYSHLRAHLRRELAVSGEASFSRSLASVL